jgi:hypothetical protein
MLWLILIIEIVLYVILMILAVAQSILLRWWSKTTGINSFARIPIGLSFLTVSGLLLIDFGTMISIVAMTF